MKELFESLKSEVPNGLKVYSYPKELFNLQEEIMALLIEKNYIKSKVPLEDLHKYIPIENQIPDGYIINKVITSFYETGPNFQKAYFKFVKYVADNIIHQDVIFQTTPTIRFHFPLTQGARLETKYRASNGKAILHHIDSMQGHPFEEINCWVPIAKCYGSNALQIGSLENSIKILNILSKELGHNLDLYYKQGKSVFLNKMLSDPEFSDFVLKNTKPLDMEYGELLLFDSRCIHGPDENFTQHTRISLDFRMIPCEAYANFSRTYQSAARTGRKFERGDVFYEKSVSELSI